MNPTNLALVILVVALLAAAVSGAWLAIEYFKHRNRLRPGREHCSMCSMDAEECPKRAGAVLQDRVLYHISTQNEVKRMVPDCWYRPGWAKLSPWK